MDDATFWDSLVKSGIHPDSATAIVQSHKGTDDAHLWDRLRLNGASEDAATELVKSRSAETAKPGVLSRAGEMLMGAVQHPVQSLAGMVAAPVQSAFDALFTPVVGQARPDLRLSKGGVAPGVDNSKHGQPYTAEDGAISRGRMLGAGAQTALNAATPGLFRGAQAAAEPLVGPLIARLMALGGTGAAQGAANNPDDPAAAAVAGSVGSMLVGETANQATRGVNAGRSFVSTRARVKAAPTLGTTQQRMAADVAAADAANYGAAKAEGAQNLTSPALQSALADPDISPYVETVRGSSRFNGADDATIAREAYRLMSVDRKGIREKMMTKGGSNAALDIQDGNLAAAQKRLKAATAAESEKPPVVFDVPSMSTSTDPFIREDTPGPLKSTSFSIPSKTTTGFAPESNRFTGDASEFPNGPTYERATPTDPSRGKGLLSYGLRTSHEHVPIEGPPTTGTPGFVLRGKAKPGVQIETPAMRVQTAPAEAVPPVMPSFPSAVEASARLRSLLQQFQEGSNDARRIMKQPSVAGKNLGRNTPEAILAKIDQLTPEQAQAVRDGFLGRGKEALQSPFKSPHLTTWGIVKGVLRPSEELSRLKPFLDALDTKAGQTPRARPISVIPLLQRAGILLAPKPRGLFPADSSE